MTVIDDLGPVPLKNSDTFRNSEANMKPSEHCQEAILTLEWAHNSVIFNFFPDTVAVVVVVINVFKRPNGCIGWPILHIPSRPSFNYPQHCYASNGKS